MPPLIFLATRHLRQSRLRTALSALAVALGVAMTVAANFVGRAFRNSLSQADDVQTILVGLLDQLDRMLLLVGVMVTAAAGFLVFNAFAMTITQRQKQIGALRSLGMTRRQVMGLVLVEALIVGGLGTLLGLVVGPLLGWGVYALFRAFDVTFNVSGQGVIAPFSLLVAAGLGLGVTLLSVLIPAWWAARVSPLLALRPEVRAGTARSPKGWGFLGGGVILLLGVYLSVAPPGEWVMPPWNNALTGLFALVWLLGLGLLLPALIGGAASWGARALGRFGATGRLIADNLGRERRRVVLTIATLAVGLAMIVGMTGFITFWIVATVFGGNAVGVRDLALWPTAWRAVQPALLTGFLGLMAAPFICGAAAWLPIRALLRQSVVGSLQLD